AALPWGACVVRMQLRVRTFFCDHPTCPRQIFTQRLPPVAAPWARRTLRLAQLLLAYCLALGGDAGARRVARLSLRPSQTPCCAWYRRPRPPLPPLHRLSV